MGIFAKLALVFKTVSDTPSYRKALRMSFGDVTGTSDATESVLKADISEVHRLKAVKDGQYSDPVYKKLSVINGEINKMSREQLKERLLELKLDTRGVREVLKKRLKSYYKNRKLMKARLKAPGGTKYDYIIVIDFEATCEQNNDNYKHEIIEFPAILVDVHRMEVVDEFHSFCKPQLNKKLSQFCSELTGISQKVVEEANEFSVVLKKIEEWMAHHKLGETHKYAILTDGPWDMSRFLYQQCQISKVIFPKWGRKWINIRKVYANYYQCRRGKLEVMLESLGMRFEGTLHCGLHDARNIARIAIRLMQDGCALKTNEYLAEKFSAQNQKTEIQVESQDHGNSEEDETEDAKNSDISFDEQSFQIGQSLGKLQINPSGSSEDSDTQECDDLLEYYRLQST